jgi:drug/metabolite transporter (DMT)-like permease
MIIFGYLLMCSIFGTTFLAIKVGIDAGTPPFIAAGIRFFLAGLILFLWMVWKKRRACPFFCVRRCSSREWD